MKRQVEDSKKSNVAVNSNRLKTQSYKEEQVVRAVTFDSGLFSSAVVGGAPIHMKGELHTRAEEASIKNYHMSRAKELQTNALYNT